MTDDGLNVWECRVEAALRVIERHGGTDGAHHKQWVLDQVVRCLKAHHYDKWLEEFEADGGEWDVGIAP